MLFIALCICCTFCVIIYYLVVLLLLYVLYLFLYLILFCRFFFFNQKPAYEMRISDWSSDVCSSDLAVTAVTAVTAAATVDQPVGDDEDTPGEYDDDEIVVTGTRLAGQLDTDFAPEAELDEAAVASYGVSSIEELLEALEPQTRSGRGRGGGRPVILVNGRRISGFGAVRHIPPAAIATVADFPEEVALQYGYSATERVVNFVLKPDFRQISAEAEAGVPTQGGQFKSEQIGRE